MNADHRDAFALHAKRRLGPRWVEQLPLPADHRKMDDRLLGFWLEYILHHERLPDVSIARDYALNAPRVVHREWLEARLATHLSVHEAVDVRPGEGLTLHDLLTDERSPVHDVMASRSLLPRECLLACVVPYEDRAELTLAHPFKLPASAAAEVVAALRRHLRTRKKTLPRERLLEPAVMRWLVEEWSDIVDRLAHAPAPRPRNTDGDAQLMTMDHFDVVGDALEATRRIVALDGAGEERVERNGDEIVVPIIRPSSGESLPGDTVIGSVTIFGRRMLIATNSIARADALRARVEQACGALVHHRAREHADPTSPAARASRSREILLAEMETSEARLDPSERIDLATLRRNLGMDVEAAAPSRAAAAPRDADPWPSLLAAVDVMRETAPWTWMVNEDVIAIVDDVTGTTLYGTFLGAGGEILGFLALDGPEGWSSFVEMAHGSGDPFDAPFAQHGLSIWLGHRADLSPEMRAILTRAGYRPRGRGAWPAVLVHEPGLVPRVPGDDEAALLARVLPRAIVLAEQWRVAPTAPGEMLVSRGSAMTREPWPAVDRVEKPVPAADPMALGRAVKAKRIDSTWHLDHWYLPAAIADRDPAWYPRQVTVLESATGLVLAVDLLEPDTHADAGARDLVLRLMAERGRPQRIVTRRASLARALAPLTPHVAIVHDPDPSIWLELRESMNAALINAPSSARGARRGGKRPKR
jgi:hypothetical protein